MEVETKFDAEDDDWDSAAKAEKGRRRRERERRKRFMARLRAERKPAMSSQHKTIKNAE